MQMQGSRCTTQPQPGPTQKQQQKSLQVVQTEQMRTQQGAETAAQRERQREKGREGDRERITQHLVSLLVIEDGVRCVHPQWGDSPQILQCYERGCIACTRHTSNE